MKVYSNGREVIVVDDVFEAQMIRDYFFTGSGRILEDYDVDEAEISVIASNLHTSVDFFSVRPHCPECGGVR